MIRKVAKGPMPFSRAIVAADVSVVMVRFFLVRVRLRRSHKGARRLDAVT